MNGLINTTVALLLAFLVYVLLPKERIFEKLDEILPF